MDSARYVGWEAIQYGQWLSARSVRWEANALGAV